MANILFRMSAKVEKTDASAVENTYAILVSTKYTASFGRCMSKQILAPVSTKSDWRVACTLYLRRDRIAHWRRFAAHRCIIRRHFNSQHCALWKL